MKEKVPTPPDARQELGHSREKVRLERPATPPRPAAERPVDQADGYADDVKNPPGNHQRR